MNTKTILAATFLTALFAGTSAIAGDNDYLHDDSAYTTTDTVEMQKVSIQAPAEESGYVFQDSNK